MGTQGEILFLHLVAGKAASGVERDPMAKGRDETMDTGMEDEATWQP